MASPSCWPRSWHWRWRRGYGLSTRDLKVTGRGIGTIAAVLVLLAGIYGVSLLHAVSATPQPNAATANAEPFTPERLASLRAGGKPVFVDATAAWCITCLVNEQAVLSRPDVQAAFNDRHVAYLVADWTNRNDTITQLLGENGRSGVPLYLYYAPGADKPVILPQILTEAGVLDAVNELIELDFFSMRSRWRGSSIASAYRTALAGLPAWQTDGEIVNT